MHGSMIVLTNKDYDKSIRDYRYEVCAVLDVDYIGEKIEGDVKKSLIDNLNYRISHEDTFETSVYDAVRLHHIFPVVVIDRSLYAFRTYIEFKAYDEYFGMEWLNNQDLYEVDVYDFHY